MRVKEKGKHRSRALAKRHQKSLERKYRVPVRIVDRRKANGRKSRRGRTFTFEFLKVPKRKKGQPLIDWIVSWEYGERRLDFYVTAASKERAEQKVFLEVKKDEDYKWAKGLPWTVKVKRKSRAKKEAIKRR